MKTCKKCGIKRGVQAFQRYSDGTYNKYCKTCALLFKNNIEEDYSSILKRILTPEEYEKYVKKEEA